MKNIALTVTVILLEQRNVIFLLSIVSLKQILRHTLNQRHTFRLGNIANGKLQLFITLNQSKLHCYTLSTICTLFKLASEVGPRTNTS